MYDHQRARLQQQLLPNKKPAAQLECLKDMWQGGRALILGCGGSLTHVTKDQLRQEVLTGATIIAMKQAYYYPYPEDVAWHLVSRWKAQPYRYATRSQRPTILALDHPQYHYSGLADIRLNLVRSATRQSLVYRQNFDRWTFERTPARLHGPGLLYELGLYLAVHLGVKEIVTLGIDFDRGPHFYQQDAKIMADLKKPRWHGNPAECQAHVDGIVPWRDWLLSRGITWKFWDTPAITPLRQHLPSFTPESAHA